MKPSSNFMNVYTAYTVCRKLAEIGHHTGRECVLRNMRTKSSCLGPFLQLGNILVSGGSIHVAFKAEHNYVQICTHSFYYLVDETEFVLSPSVLLHFQIHQGFFISAAVSD